MISGFLVTDITTVWSASTAVNVSPDNGKSAVKIVYKMDPKDYLVGLQIKFLQYLYSLALL